MASATLFGMKEFQENLKKLKEKEVERLAFQSALAGAGVVRNLAKRNLKQQGLIDTGAILRNIAVARQKKPGKAMYQIGVRSGRKSKGAQRLIGRGAKVSYVNDPFYWWFHEFGTSKMPARPFLVPALQEAASTGKAFTAMQKRALKSLEKYLKK